MYKILLRPRQNPVLINIQRCFSRNQRGKVFNDPIHGHIELPHLCVKIVDTPQFQRLRYLKQLGACYFVYPGAAHNRFEHCIGVSYLAGRLVRTLKKYQPDLKITSEDALCVEIAGLCHDLGHGPFSHMFDQEFIPKVRCGNWTHEEASVMMFEHMLEENNLLKEFENHGLKDRDITFIKEQITGPDNGRTNTWTHRGREEKKSFLYEIVANKRNGIDVDKWDYFARDCHGLGIINHFDHKRCMKFARVLKADGACQICFRDKEAETLYSMYQIRANLHRRAAQHRVSNAIQAMITDAFIKANKTPLVPGKDGALLRLADCIDDPVAYTNLNDSIFHVILMSKDDELAESRAILRRIQLRKLYKCVGETYAINENAVLQHSEEEIKGEIVSKTPEDSYNKLEKDDLIVRKVKLDYGRNESNPIDNVRFYNRADDNTAKKLENEHRVSLTLPRVFAENFIRVYYKKDNKKSIEIAKRCFQDWCQENEIKAKEDFLLHPPYGRENN